MRYATMTFKTDNQAYTYFLKVYGFLDREKKINYFKAAMKDQYGRDMCQHMNKVEWKRFWHSAFDDWAYNNDVEWENNTVLEWW